MAPSPGQVTSGTLCAVELGPFPARSFHAAALISPACTHPCCAADLPGLSRHLSTAGDELEWAAIELADQEDGEVGAGAPSKRREFLEKAYGILAVPGSYPPPPRQDRCRSTQPTTTRPHPALHPLHVNACCCCGGGRGPARTL